MFAGCERGCVDAVYSNVCLHIAVARKNIRDALLFYYYTVQSGLEIRASAQTFDMIDMVFPRVVLRLCVEFPDRRFGAIRRRHSRQQSH